MSNKPDVGRRTIMRTNRENHPDCFWLERVGDDFSKYADGFTWCYLEELTQAYDTAKKMVAAVGRAQSVSAARRAVNVLFDELTLGEEK